MRYLQYFLLSSILYASNIELITTLVPSKVNKTTKVIYRDYSSIYKTLEPKTTEPITVKKLTEYGTYSVQFGDTLTKVSNKFSTKLKYIANLNGIDNISHLRVGQRLKLPLSQFMIDTISTAKYKIVSGDTIYGIAKRFNLSSQEIIAINSIKDVRRIRIGQKIILPFPHIKHIPVTATAYTSHVNQTDDTPFIAAWNNRLKPGMKIIAVSRDLLTKYGLRNGTEVKISGLKGKYTVRDKMNKRYKKRIDIYMGLDINKARQWGKRAVTLSW